MKRWNAVRMFVGLLVVIVLVGCNVQEPQQGSLGGSSAVSSPQPASLTRMLEGSEGSLTARGSAKVRVALEESAFGDLFNALENKDQNALDGLEKSGRLISVAPGTRVRVAFVSGPKRQIRILDGEHKDKTGWVLSDWIQ